MFDGHPVHTVYGAICGVSILIILAILCVVCVGIYIKCKHKGTVIFSDVVVFILYEQSTLHALTRSFGEHSNGREPCI